jgi:hypothetical protein
MGHCYRRLIPHPTSKKEIIKQNDLSLGKALRPGNKPAPFVIDPVAVDAPDGPAPGVKQPVSVYPSNGSLP